MTLPNATVNIATACDNAYVQHAAVFLKSLFASNRQTAFRVFVIVPNDFRHRHELQSNVGPYGRQLEFLSVTSNDTYHLKTFENHLTVAAFFRLFIDKLVPATMDRILYLDSDILVTGSLEDLWATDLADCVIGATTDVVLDDNATIRQRTRLSPTAHYLNSGVLLIDLRRWRDERFGERTIDFASKHLDLITWADQCAINHVLNGQFKELTKKWNFQSLHLRWTAEGQCTAETLRELQIAHIVHFTGSMKPWHYLDRHPLKPLYWQYLRETEWHNYVPPDRTLRNVLKMGLKCNAPGLLTAFRRVRRYGRSVGP